MEEELAKITELNKLTADSPSLVHGTPNLRSKIFEKCLPVFLHLAMILGVVLYVVLGAYAIQRIEARRVSGWSDENFTSAVPHAPSEKAVSTLERVERSLKRRRMSSRYRHCIAEMVEKLAAERKCNLEGITLLGAICNTCAADYEEERARVLSRRARGVARGNPLFGPRRAQGGKAVSGRIIAAGWEYWTIKDSILFCFTIITTIGYGNVAPLSSRTNLASVGQIFVICYGLLGIPIAMLVIANMGQFMRQFMARLLRGSISTLSSALRQCAHLCRRRKRSSPERVPIVMRRALRNLEIPGISGVLLDSYDEDDFSFEENPHRDAFVLFLTFLLYVAAGSWLISRYEPHMDYFKAVYFNFVTLTTIGLGDVVPENAPYLLFTLIYCSLGLALTTVAIEISASYLRRLHYFGRKIEKVANVKIWFGAKRLTMKQLVKNLGDKFNLPELEMKDLDLERFVDDAIRVESGEMSTLRTGRGRTLYITDLKNAFKEGRVLYVDEDEDAGVEYIITSRTSSSVFPSVFRTGTTLLRPNGCGRTNEDV